VRAVFLQMRAPEQEAMHKGSDRDHMEKCRQALHPKRSHLRFNAAFVDILTIELPEPAFHRLQITGMLYVSFEYCKS
jgi:hypothetical protein